jgi:hypothetical protein
MIELGDDFGFDGNVFWGNLWTNMKN